MNREERGIEINLIQLVKRLIENVKYIILVVAVFGIMGYAGTSMFMTPIYQADVKMIVSSRIEQSQNITSDQLNSARNLVETYAVIIRGRDVLNHVVTELDLSMSHDQLANAITVRAINNTPVMQLSVRHSNRDTALQIARELMEIAPNVLVDTTGAGSVQQVEQAYAGPNPVSPNIMKNTILAAVVGFALSCMVILILFLADNRYKTDLDIQNDLGLPVLGVIPAVESCYENSTHQKTGKGEKAV